ncbi:two-component system NarL family sensor kinase [Pseudomonas sp. URMO17WK12:I1]|uniref:cache domain-containing protein n=1 Tax=unclassified Pseudomonas TaxID=196821 RepID=UPI0004874FFB|nr:MULTISPECIES: cache domain-containing protein [unclassified Pseudomonas]PZW70168.1 two-component system NarL family sensor kinase [Pseudomonas sp. URMO17WK12:I1]
MQLKHKIVALSLLPMLLAVAVVCLLVLIQNQRLGNQQAQLIEHSILGSKQAELQHYVEMAMSTIAPLYDSGRDDEETKLQVLALLQRINFGSDGYFFVYDRNGKNLMHPRQATLVGKDLWNMTDPHGLLVIQALIRSATEGDGFQRYAWQKPSTGQVAEKLAYVTQLDRWGWMLGTGIYLEDVDNAIAQVRHDVGSGIRTTMLAIAIVALIAVLLVFASGLTLNVSEHRLADRKLQQLTQRIITSQEEERSRLSRELHDGISQLLVSIKFKFELAAHELDAGKASAAQTLRQGIERLAGAIGEVRRISHDLHPSLLDTLGLASAIGQLASEFEQRSGLRVDYDNSLGDIRLSDDMNVALFRILQEALTNIERHAGAGQVTIQLTGNPRRVNLRISDDGTGFSPRQAEQSGGIGLRNIRERVEHFGGDFSITSTPAGTVLTVALLLSADAPQSRTEPA